MPGRRWTVLEDAIALFFKSRGANCESCSRILRSRCNSERRPNAILQRLIHLRTVSPEIWTDQGWNVAMVDQWIANRLPATFDAVLLNLTITEINEVNQVYIPIKSTRLFNQN